MSQLLDKSEDNYFSNSELEELRALFDDQLFDEPLFEFNHYSPSLFCDFDYYHKLFLESGSLQFEPNNNCADGLPIRRRDNDKDSISHEGDVTNEVETDYKPVLSHYEIGVHNSGLSMASNEGGVINEIETDCKPVPSHYELGVQDGLCLSMPSNVHVDDGNQVYNGVSLCMPSNVDDGVSQKKFTNNELINYRDSGIRDTIDISQANNFAACKIEDGISHIEINNSNSLVDSRFLFVPHDNKDVKSEIIEESCLMEDGFKDHYWSMQSIPKNKRSKRARFEGCSWTSSMNSPSEKQTKQPCEKQKKRNKKSLSVETRKCSHCEATKTPQWREGPLGKGTLCNACGVRFKLGKLQPEYRPAASPSFSRGKHSNYHKQIMKMKLGDSPREFRKICVRPNKFVDGLDHEALAFWEQSWERHGVYQHPTEYSISWNNGNELDVIHNGLHIAY